MCKIFGGCPDKVCVPKLAGTLDYVTLECQLFLSLRRALDDEANRARRKRMDFLS